MNLVGKLLVVLILVMSVAFMAFSVAVYSTHKNWIDVITNPNTGYQAKLKEQQAINAKLTEQLTKNQEEANVEKKALEDKISKLETKRTALQGDVTTLSTQVADLKTETAKQLAALTTAQTTLDEKMKQVDALRADITTTQQERDDNLNKFKESQASYNNAYNELRLLKDANTRLVGQMGHAKILLERQGVSPEASVDGVPPKVDGVILMVGRDNLVEISLGSDDGIHRGNTLEVFRANKYKGRLEVVQTSPDKSVAKIIPGFQQAKIERDDRVATRFN
jgi:hypothetical protein